MKDSENTRKWDLVDYETLQNRETWYSNVAEAYNKVRPRYPQTIIHRAVELAELSADARILEIGCGPGIATVEFSKLGYSILGLEPSLEAYQFARQNCTNHPQVEILNTTFEDWELDPKKFNAVLAASSFHWISPEQRYQKTAEALQENGSLILLWNTPPQPSYTIYQELEAIYQTIAPFFTGYESIETHEKNLKHLGELVINSGFFKEIAAGQLVSEVTYSIDDYLALLSTLSPYICLETQARNSLFARLKETLESNYGQQIALSYLTVLQVFKKNK